jgi:thymidylate kinase
VLELMDAERAALGHQRIGQAHLLLALLRTETDAPGRAAIQLLACLGVQAEHVRERLQSVLANPSQLRTGPETAPPTKRGSTTTRELIPRSHDTVSPTPGTDLSRPTRLVIVEGIMGAGKSWTGQWLARELGRHGIESRFIAEGRTREGEVHPLRVATTLAHPRAPWRELTVQEYVDRSLAMWRAFVEDAQSSSRVTVCDGLLFHGNLTDAMLMGAAPSALADYVTQVARTARPLAPALVYLRQLDVAAALRRVSQQRGPTWVNYQVDWKLASPYAERRGLRGYDGLVELYRAYVPLCLDLLDRLDLPKLVLERDGDWPQVRRAVRTFLQLEDLKEC